MKKINFLEIIRSEEYSFLNTNRDLGDNIILLVPGGSHAYGTNVEGSDIDIRGVTIERPEVILGLSQFEQFENSATDTTIYGLRKIFSLLLNSNPNVIELLGSKPEHIIKISKEGQLIRDNVNLFLSKRAFYSFGGYATAQLRRLQNALARDSYPQEEKELHILKSIQHQIKHLQENYTAFGQNSLKIYLDTSEKEGFSQEVHMDITLKNYPMRDFKNIYAEMHNVIKDYSKLNHRNNKKSDAHLNKHAMHLVRLLKMGIEILNGEGVNTYREKDREELLEIRNGKYQKEDGTFQQEFFDMVDKLENNLARAFENSLLPTKPNYKEVEKLLMNIYKERLK